MGAANLIDLKEVLVANGLAMIAMWYLLDCRRKNRESAHTEDRLYDGMCLANLIGALFETISFLIDGTDIFAGIQINYLANTLCFLGTVTIGFLWSMYVDLRIFKNYKRMEHRTKLLCIPWVIEIIAILINFFGTGLLFTISEANVYTRGTGAIIGYVSLMLYFGYSIVVVLRSKKDGSNLHFFPIQYFVGPCILGVLIQFFFYGITTSWVSVALALVFVQMQTYAENLYRDELSGLFNRRFLNRAFERRDRTNGAAICGIMLDINDFKAINDNFGHSVGDRAIRTLGETLFRAIPEGAKAVRYAGDEFIILMPNADEQLALQTMEEIRAALAKVNESTSEPFTLNAAMGCAKLEPGDDSEAFLRHMDEKMYEEKRAFHRAQQATLAGA